MIIKQSIRIIIPFYNNQVFKDKNKNWRSYEKYFIMLGYVSCWYSFIFESPHHSAETMASLSCGVSVSDPL